MADSNILLRVEHLCKEFPVYKGFIAKHSKNARSVHAVNDVSFDIAAGETFGLVGESGCGKSTLGRTILRLLEATDGEVLFEGQNILKYNKAEMRGMRRKMQMIFQDPCSSIICRLTVEDIIAEYMIVNKSFGGNRREIYQRTAELMDIVGLAKRLA